MGSMNKTKVKLEMHRLERNLKSMVDLAKQVSGSMLTVSYEHPCTDGYP
jgi:hypothetical protein